MPPAVVLVRLAMIANLVSAGLLASAFALSHRLFAGGDEMAHFDYAFQLWHGGLPVWDEGLVVQPPWGARPPVQWTSQHPPLYYLLIAPMVGLFVDDGRYLAAGYAARAVSAVIAVGVTAAVMWLGREAAPRRPALWLTAGAVTAVSPPVVMSGGSISNDNLLVAFGCMLIAVTVRMLRLGPTPWAMVWFGVSTAGVMWSRASGMVFVGLCGAALGCAWLLRRPPAWRAVVGLGCSAVTAVASISWFYLRNVQSTGNVFGARWEWTRPDVAYVMRNRVERSFDEVILNPAVWRGWHEAWGSGVIDPLWSAGLLVAAPLLTASVLMVRRMLRRPTSYEIWTVLILAGLVIGIVVLQTEYAANRGGASWRYLKPQLPAIALSVGLTLTAARRLSSVLIPTWILAALLPLAAGCVRSLFETDPHTTAPTFPLATSVALTMGVVASAVSVMAIVLLTARGPHLTSSRSSIDPAAARHADSTLGDGRRTDVCGCRRARYSDIPEAPPERR